MALKKDFWDGGFLGRVGMLVFPQPLHCKKTNKKKGQKNKKKRIKNWESSGNSGLRTADPAPRESQISQRSPGGRGRKKKKRSRKRKEKKKTNQEEDKKRLEGKKNRI